MLNEFFEQMIEAVFKNFGHLNRFMGAGLMAPFGALRGRSVNSIKGKAESARTYMIKTVS